jgi:hypothetical protein
MPRATACSSANVIATSTECPAASHPALAPAGPKMKSDAISVAKTAKMFATKITRARRRDSTRSTRHSLSAV